MWSGIEDESRNPAAVWLSRLEETDDWTPLRKSDCQRINANATYDEVTIECGRRTAHLKKQVISHNFVPRAREYKLCSAVWFMTEERNKETVLCPVADSFDTAAIESLYHRAVEVVEKNGDIAALLKEEIILQDGASKVQVRRIGGELSLRFVPGGSWFFTQTVQLQRGYGEYEVPGEDTELSLGPVEHVIFVVHGIGEAFFSRDEVQIAGLIDQVETARVDIQQKQLDRWTKYKSEGDPPPGRIEFIPVEWYSSVHDESSAMMQSLRATTLPTIPALRSIANDVVFDVLMYLTPSFCQQVLETVTTQICSLHQTFQDIHPDFVRRKGSFSLAGHSLGSVICWDLLAVLKKSTEAPQSFEMVGDECGAAGDWGPPVKINQNIPFKPRHTFFLGSPLGMFLTLRGSHPVLDGMSKTEHDVSKFVLPTTSLYNIFHPRIEPLLLPQSIEELPPAIYLTVPGESVRLHLKAKKLGDIVKKSIFDKTSASRWSSLVDGAVALAAETTSKEGADDPASELIFPLGGTNKRVDLSLQPNLIDNSYVSAVMAHGCYFYNADVQNFFIGVLTPRPEKQPVPQATVSPQGLQPAFG